MAHVVRCGAAELEFHFATDIDNGSGPAAWRDTLETRQCGGDVASHLPPLFADGDARSERTPLAVALSIRAPYLIH